jgi:hypothetical protein
LKSKTNELSTTHWGVKIKPGEDPGTFYLSQPHLIESILEDLKLLNHGATAAKSADMLATFENKLHKTPTVILLPTHGTTAASSGR